VSKLHSCRPERRENACTSGTVEETKTELRESVTGLSAGSGGTARQRMRPERALRADTREPLDEPFT